jgi:hypothetical protein
VKDLDKIINSNQQAEPVESPVSPSTTSLPSGLSEDSQKEKSPERDVESVLISVEPGELMKELRVAQHGLVKRLDQSMGIQDIKREPHKTADSYVRCPICKYRHGWLDKCLPY